jgi:hypothetical protein
VELDTVSPDQAAPACGGSKGRPLGLRSVAAAVALLLLGLAASVIVMGLEMLIRRCRFEGPIGNLYTI